MNIEDFISSAAKKIVSVLGLEHQLSYVKNLELVIIMIAISFLISSVALLILAVVNWRMSAIRKAAMRQFQAELTTPRRLPEPENHRKILHAQRQLRKIN